MPEYFTLEIEQTDDADVCELITNQTLVESEEIYTDPKSGENGSTIAQTIFFAVDGIQALTLIDDTLIVRRNPDVPWELLIDEIRDVLRDFFL